MYFINKFLKKVQLRINTLSFPFKAQITTFFHIFSPNKVCTCIDMIVLHRHPQYKKHSPHNHNIDKVKSCTLC